MAYGELHITSLVNQYTKWQSVEMPFSADEIYSAMCRMGRWSLVLVWLNRSTFELMKICTKTSF